MASSVRSRRSAGNVDLYIFHEPAINLRLDGDSVDGLLAAIVLASSRVFDRRSHRGIDSVLCVFAVASGNIDRPPANHIVFLSSATQFRREDRTVAQLLSPLFRADFPDSPLRHRLSS